MALFDISGNTLICSLAESWKQTGWDSEKSGLLPGPRTDPAQNTCKTIMCCFYTLLFSWIHQMNLNMLMWFRGADRFRSGWLSPPAPVFMLSYAKRLAMTSYFLTLTLQTWEWYRSPLLTLDRKASLSNVPHASNSPPPAHSLHFSVHSVWVILLLLLSQ